MTAIDSADEARIRVLPSDLIDRIAAGEVIERPASVVKELVENAIDAGARAVRVSLSEGGLTRLCVEDDGRGMSRTDARTSLLRHATSKLVHPEDLFAIRTLGFRGEALSSIGAVSRLTLTTRRASDATAVRLVTMAGEVVSVSEVGAPVGTRVDVEDLFFNTPARRKFMRSPATEQAHVVDVALRVILGASDCGIVVMSGERRLLDVPEDASDTARIVAALGSKVEAVYPFAATVDAVRVSGYVTASEIDRSDAKGMWFFVNGRYVRDRMLQRAVLDGYRTLLPNGRYPVCVVHVEIAADAVDVNVHPQKLEVRFSDGQTVFRAVSAALTEVLARTPWIQGALGARAATEAYFERVARQAEPARPWSYGAPQTRPMQVRESILAEKTQPQSLGLKEGGYFTRLDVVGEVLARYLVCQSDTALVLVDVKAAAAQLALDALEAQHLGGAVASEALLFPESIEHPQLEATWQLLTRYGFEVEPVGPGRFVVRAVPAVLAGADVLTLTREAITAVSEKADVLGRCARHAVARRDARALLAELDRIGAKGVHKELSGDELARLVR